jgi:IS30 family transposase
MKRRYKQMGLEERERFAILMAKGHSLREVAKILGRHHSTLSRELLKSDVRKFTWCYIPYLADIRAERRRKASRPWRVLKNASVRAYVEEKIPLGWSPEQVSGRIKIDLPGQSVSHEAIYKFIYYQADHLIEYLSRKRKSRYPKYRGRRSGKRRSPVRIPNRTHISKRPRSALVRKVFGHWESDSVVSKASPESLNVLVERKSRFTCMTKLKRKTARQTYEAIHRRLSCLSKRARRSITYDNGSENFQHELVNQALGTTSYFCSPYHSWEKGTVENTNSLIRRFIPKKTDIAKVTDLEIQTYENLLNNRPRKCLGYRTPKEVFLESGAVE